MWRRAIFRHFSKSSERLPLQPLDTLHVRIESLHSCGNGFVAWDGNWKIRIPSVLPGELVQIRIKKLDRNQRIIDAELISVIESSQSRVKPKCQYFESCSGCQLQHMEINAQREWKRNVVINYLLSKNISNVLVNPVLGTDQIYGYRSKITPTCVFTRRGAIGGEIGGKRIKSIGYFNRFTHEAIDVKHCSVASDLINARFASFRDELIHHYETQLDDVDPSFKNNLRPLVLRESDEPHPYVEVDQTKFVSQTVLGYQFRFSANDFFQINSSLLPIFFQYISQQARSPSVLSASTSSPSPPRKYNYLIDTYCGCGVFSIILSPYFKEIVGIDIAVRSLRSAIKNKTLNSLTNVYFKQGGADGIFSTIHSFPSDETVVIMDPSRKGSDQAFLNQLFKFSPVKVVYVACDVETQVRDCELMIKNGYEIVDCQPFDMFPQTSHIENVITLERRDKTGGEQ
jgi:tRNA/tmRNA/rRNA uracil-C5-methylase (TrmA/RlmC/RlmD family)